MRELTQGVLIWLKKFLLGLVVHVYVPFFVPYMYSVRIHFRSERCDICVDLYMIYNYMLRMALLDRIRGWFYYVFIDKRSEGDLSRPSIIGDISIRSSQNTLAY